MQISPTYGYLLLAIICEVIATSCLKSSEQFTKLIPSVISLSSYGLSFYFLSITLKYIPISIAYAIWSSLGIVLIAIIGVIAFKQHLDFPAYLGIGLIIAGVVVINLFSKSVNH